MEIKKVGVIGCGFMGSGIAQVCAQSGYDVLVCELNEDVLKKGLASIDYFLSRSVQKGSLSKPEKTLISSRLKGTTSLKDLKDRDLVIEVVTEDLEIKKKIFAEIDKICPKSTIFTSNTSCLPIKELGKATSRPQKVMGTHFLSPVPPSKLMEIIRSEDTGDATFQTIKKFGLSLGKEVLVVTDTPGFIFNRLLVALQVTAIRMLEEGIASKEDIDKSMTLGLGHPIGPLALSDFNGLDVTYLVAKNMCDQTKAHEYKPPAILKNLVAKGKLGRKSGEGFYNYNQK